MVCARVSTTAYATVAQAAPGTADAYFSRSSSTERGSAADRAAAVVALRNLLITVAMRRSRCATRTRPTAVEVMAAIPANVSTSAGPMASPELREEVRHRHSILPGYRRHRQRGSAPMALPSW